MIDISSYEKIDKIKLTSDQEKILHSITERNLEWHKVYNEIPPSYSSLLTENYNKLISKIISPISNANVTSILNNTLDDYNLLIRYYNEK